MGKLKLFKDGQFIELNTFPIKASTSFSTPTVTAGGGGGSVLYFINGNQVANISTDVTTLTMTPRLYINRNGVTGTVDLDYARVILASPGRT